MATPKPAPFGDLLDELGREDVIYPAPPGFGSPLADAFGTVVPVRRLVLKAPEHTGGLSALLISNERFGFSR